MPVFVNSFSTTEVLSIDSSYMDAEIAYLAAGGNLHPSAADWDLKIDLLAYGAGNSLALWQPNNSRKTGLHALLKGHNSTITAVKFLHSRHPYPHLASGSADGQIILWLPVVNHAQLPSYSLSIVIDAHQNSIECLEATNKVPGIIISGSADGTIKIWKATLLSDDRANLELFQVVVPDKSIIPLALALHALDKGSAVLAVGGTRSFVALYVLQANGLYVKQSELVGHEAWIRSLSFTEYIEADSNRTHILLASASQDKFIRLWRIRKASCVNSQSAEKAELYNQKNSDMVLYNKLHRLQSGTVCYNVMLEALLVGHDDWIYSVKWSTATGEPLLLSISADNTAIVWKVERDDDIWLANSRMGEISNQKGSTSATGSTGGLWNGLWGPEARSIIGLTKSGSWRRWDFNESGTWQQSLGISGHTKTIHGLSWSQDGSFLLTASADQTSRLHAEWHHDETSSWHEFCRPQIHGYNINCIGALDNFAFVSGAEEKLLRVFNGPDDIARLLERLCRAQAHSIRNVSVAGIPVLGLSNKSEELFDDLIAEDAHNALSKDQLNSRRNKIAALETPPLEEHLSKHTLWPEKEKLYGHGFEINTLAVSHDSSIIATSCKASSLDHAVIRLFSARDWRQIQPPLKAHNLTVTSLQFSDNGRWLLSGGRDRQWIVWEREHSAEISFRVRVLQTKAHSKMILSVAWTSTHGSAPSFATGGRDKLVKIWRISDTVAELCATIEVGIPVLTMSACSVLGNDKILLAAGTEDGQIKLYKLTSDSLQQYDSLDLPPHLLPAASITRLAWRPLRSVAMDQKQSQSKGCQLAAACEDRSLRVISI